MLRRGAYAVRRQTFGMSVLMDGIDALTLHTSRKYPYKDKKDNSEVGQMHQIQPMFRAPSSVLATIMLPEDLNRFKRRRHYNSHDTNPQALLMPYHD